MVINPKMFLRRAHCTNIFKYGLAKFNGSNCVKQSTEQSDIKKSITVAFVGFTNAGKSTLINAISGLKICAASKRPLTTVECQHVFYVQGDTRIILLDTPGILSRELKAKSNFTDSEYVLRTRSVQKAHLVGVIVDVSCRFARNDVKSHMKFLSNMFSSDTEFVLILNKVDLLQDKIELLNIAENFYTMPFAAKSSSNARSIDARKFSQIFMISALKKDGVQHVVEYFRSVAPEFLGASPNTVSDHPDSKIVEQTVRAALLEYIQEEIPYKCTSQVEYMTENSSGECQIVVLIKCPSMRCYLAVSRESLIEKIRKNCVRDLQSLFGKTVFLHLQVVLDKIKKK